MNQSHAHDRSATGSERRRFPRFRVREKLLGHLLETDRPVRIRDIGFGGFATETVEPLPVGRVVAVRFTSPDDRSAVLEAESLHSWPSCADDGTPCYVTGFRFTEGSPRQQVEQLVETVTTVGLYRDV
jgi:hypothetical protein